MRFWKKSGASDFLIRETTTCSREAFFIGQKLDMGRAKKVNAHLCDSLCGQRGRQIPRKRYKEIHPTSTPEEMEKEIRSALFAAKFVKNPWYPVVSGTKAGEAETEAGDMDEELVGSSRPFASGQRPTRKSIPMRFL